DPDPARGRRAHAVAERVLPGRKPLEEEVLAAVPHFFVQAETGLPLEPGHERDGLEAGPARIAKVDVLRRLLRAQRELDLDLVTGGQGRALRDRGQRPRPCAVLAAEVAP